MATDVVAPSRLVRFQASRLMVLQPNVPQGERLERQGSCLIDEMRNRIGFRQADTSRGAEALDVMPRH